MTLTFRLHDFSRTGPLTWNSTHNGVVETGLGTEHTETTNSLVLHPDGRILVAADVHSEPNEHNDGEEGVVIRYLPNGRITVLPDGDVVVVGVTQLQTDLLEDGRKIAMARYRINDCYSSSVARVSVDDAQPHFCTAFNP